MGVRNFLNAKYNQTKGSVEKQTGRPVKGEFDILKGKLQEKTEDIQRKNNE